MKVVPSSSSACRNSRAPSRVAGRRPTTPSSRRTRSRPLRRAMRVTVSARRVRSSLAPTGANHFRRLVRQTRRLDPLTREEALDGVLVDAEDAAHADGVEPAVVDQAADGLRVNTELTRDLANAVQPA